nr:TetR/AcrR family transcriptional regulator [Desulforamulus aquiferis]
MEATEQLLNEKTFDSITMDDIALRSDFSKASIYQYFKNKEQLMNEVFSQNLKEKCQLIEDKCLSQADPIQGLRSYIMLEFEFIQQHPWIPKVVATFPFRDYRVDKNILDLYHQKKI